MKEELKNKLLIAIEGLPERRINDIIKIAQILKHSWLLELEIRALIEKGASKPELGKVIENMVRIDRCLEKKELERNFETARDSFRKWCEERGIEYEQLTDERVMEIVDEEIHKIRKEPI